MVAVQPVRMENHRVDGLSTAYEERGTGEPVVLIHAGICADWFATLLDESALTGAHRLIRYHRPGYGDSEGSEGPVSVALLAEHCRALLRHLGIARAHVVGHSSGAVVALELALSHRDVVRSLVLLETALLAVPSGPFAARALRRHADGDRAAAVDIWMRGVCGPDYREVFDAALPVRWNAPTPTRSSGRNCRPCGRGRSGRRKPGPSQDPCCSWSASAAAT